MAHKLVLFYCIFMKGHNIVIALSEQASQEQTGTISCILHDEKKKEKKEKKRKTMYITRYIYKYGSFYNSDFFLILPLVITIITIKY